MSEETVTEVHFLSVTQKTKENLEEMMEICETKDIDIIIQKAVDALKKVSNE